MGSRVRLTEQEEERPLASAFTKSAVRVALPLCAGQVKPSWDLSEAAVEASDWAVQQQGTAAGESHREAYQIMPSSPMNPGLLTLGQAG